MLFSILLALLGPATASASGAPAQPDGLAAPAGGVVGNGLPGSCDAAGLTQALSGGGTVTFHCGGPATIPLTSTLTISANTTIIGGDIITLTGGMTTRLFIVNSGVTLALQHIVLDGAASTGSDGGAIASAGTLNLDHTTIQNSQTDNHYSGGAIASSGPVTINNSQFISNTAGSGGALFVSSAQALVTIQGSQFTNNHAVNTVTGYGGAIWVGPLAQLALTDGLVIENSAQRGGGIYLSATGAVTLTANIQLDVDGNTAILQGGAIDNDGGTLAIINTSVIGNLSNFTNGAGQGGGIVSYGSLALENDQIIGNTGNVGGGVYVSSTVTNLSLSIDHSSLIGNGASATSGGGLFLEGQGVAATIVDSSFTGNVAQGQGAGLYRYSAYLTIMRSSFTGNLARQSGAGLYVNGLTPSTGGAVAIHDSTINANVNVPSTTAGAGLDNLAQVVLTNVTLKDNSDGVLTFGSGSTTLANSVLDNKRANCSGTLPIDNLGNFATSSSPCGFSGPEVGPDAKLGPEMLGPFGPTYYYVPLAGSQLWGASITACTAHDQRGALRPPACDSGAIQHDGTFPTLYLPLARR